MQSSQKEKDDKVRINLRTPKDVLEIIDSHKKENKLKDRSKATCDIVRKFDTQNEEIKELNNAVAYLKKHLLLQSSDEEIARKALFGNFPTDCPDMIEVLDDPTKRECAVKESDRQVTVPREKKTGKFIVDTPKKCWRCRALGYRKVKKESQPRAITMYNGDGKSRKKSKKSEYSRGSQSFEMGSSESYSMVDDPYGAFK